MLIVTDSAVLMTDIEASLGFSGVKPAGVSRPIPGLTAIDAVDDLLVVSFADGSKASLRQRSPDRSACEVGAKVAALAATAMGQGRDCLHKDEELEDDSAQPRG